VKTRSGWIAGAFAAVLALATAGCGVTVYEPGVYKGAKDPLVDAHAKPEQKALLKERFTMGQTDR
jgi:hypothetical protein